VAGPEKPRHRSGYGAEELEQVKAASLTVAVTLGAYLEDVCIVGGLVPALLIDTARGDRDDEGDRHPGTNDLDVGLALAVLDDERYAEISARLRAEGFEPDTNEAGNQTVQRWRLGNLKVTVDFLMPPAPDQDQRVRVQNLEGDFGALITPGLELAFGERVDIELDGHTLMGERVRRTIPVCGPAAFVVLKALAFGDRGEPKDAYDLVYVIRHTPGGGRAIAERIARHAGAHAPIVARALALLARDFDGPDGLGPQRAARFTLAEPAEPDELDNAAADAHGYAADLMTGCRELGVTQGPEP
jgi:nucleotidyltransferase AbiEii toxin of type IV toxin-antitoxin system